MSTRFSRGGVIIPSSLGRGVQQGVLNFINLRNAKKAAESDKEFRDRQLAIQERQLDSVEQNQAFDKFLKLIPLIPAGSTLAENPFILPTARLALGDLDDDTFAALGEMQLNPETLDTILRDREIKIAGDAGENSELLQRLFNFRNLGEASTDAELNLKGKRASVLNSALDVIQNDKESIRDIGLAMFGVAPDVTIPGIVDSTGTPVVFQTEGVARIWAGLQDLQFNREKLSASDQKDLVGELIEQAKGADVVLGRPQATRIVNAYEASTLGTFAPGQAPIEKLFSSSNPETQRAISIFVGAVRTGESQFEQFLGQTEDGNRILLALGLGQTLEEFLPKDQVRNALKDFLPQLESIGITVDSPGLLSIRDRFIFEPSADAADPRARVPVNKEEGAAQGEGLPPEADPFVMSVFNLLQRGVPLDDVVTNAIAFAGEERGQAAVDAAINLAAQATGEPTPEGQNRVSSQEEANVEQLSAAFLDAVGRRESLRNEAGEFFKGDVSGSSAFAKKIESNKAAAEARKILERIREINPAAAKKLEDQIS